MEYGLADPPAAAAAAPAPPPLKADSAPVDPIPRPEYSVSPPIVGELALAAAFECKRPFSDAFGPRAPLLLLLPPAPCLPLYKPNMPAAPAPAVAPSAPVPDMAGYDEAESARCVRLDLRKQQKKIRNPSRARS